MIRKLTYEELERRHGQTLDELEAYKKQMKALEKERDDVLNEMARLREENRKGQHAMDCLERFKQQVSDDLNMFDILQEARDLARGMID